MTEDQVWKIMLFPWLTDSKNFFFETGN